MQVDFNLPERFDLPTSGQDNERTGPSCCTAPCSARIERFLGVLIEHVGGSFPTWLAPEQIHLVTVATKTRTSASSLWMTSSHACV
jgi:threonyl-tRNA synthetase